MPGTTSATPKLEDLRVRLSEIRQGHLLRFADDLAPAELEALCADRSAGS
ncbi:MAG: hypothetical protein ACFHWZ_02025 [Phycisphaerales bacterium]